MKIVMLLALLGIVGALISAGTLMVKRRPDDNAGTTPPTADKRMARALAIRVGLSVALFIVVLIGWKLGWIAPRGVPLVRG
jgi:uncharacterized iron-regulated membrane protein